MAGSRRSTFTSFTGMLGGGGTGPVEARPQGDIDLVESVSYLHGKHAFKFGFEYVDMLFDGDTYQRSARHGDFLDLQSFLQGIPNERIDSTGQSHSRHAELTGSEFSLRMIGGSTPESP